MRSHWNFYPVSLFLPRPKGSASGRRSVTGCRLCRVPTGISNIWNTVCGSLSLTSVRFPYGTLAGAAQVQGADTGFPPCGNLAAFPCHCAGLNPLRLLLASASSSCRTGHRTPKRLSGFLSGCKDRGRFFEGRGPRALRLRGRKSGRSENGGWLTVVFWPQNGQVAVLTGYSRAGTFNLVRM
jgi:hypothetical protein